MTFVRRRRRADRGRAGRGARRDRARHAPARLPVDPPGRGADHPRRGDGPDPAAVPAGSLGVGAAPARAAGRRRSGPGRGSSTSTRAACASPDPTGRRSGSRRGPSLWAAGVLASSFARAVAAATGAPTDRAGPGHRRARPDDPGPPGDLRRRRCGGAAVEAGQADAGRGPGRDAGRLATPRRSSGAASSAGHTSRSATATTATSRSSAGCRASRTSAGSGRSGGRAASRPGLLWLGIHLFYLIGFSNRIVVLVRWAWTFLTHGRGTRLITGATLLPPIEEPEPPVHGADGSRGGTSASDR